MNLQEFLSRIRNNFFAIIIPGFFILFYIIMNGYSLFYKEIKDISPGCVDKYTPGHMLLDLSNAIKDHWPLVLLIIVFAYLIGNILRILHISTTDNITKKLFSWTYSKKVKWRRLFFVSDFPYPAVLNQTNTELGIKSKFSTKKEDLNSLYMKYNKWKLSLCSKKSDVFAYLSTFEEETRLFAGMFWAGFLGVVFSLSLLPIILLRNFQLEKWGVFILTLFLFSFIILFLFGRNLRRVRVIEVRQFYLAWLNLEEENVNKR